MRGATRRLRRDSAAHADGELYFINLAEPRVSRRRRGDHESPLQTLR